MKTRAQNQHIFAKLGDEAKASPPSPRHLSPRKHCAAPLASSTASSRARSTTKQSEVHTAMTTPETSPTPSSVSLLGRLIEELSEVVATVLLPKLDLVDLALLSRVNHAAREAVKDSGLPASEAAPTGRGLPSTGSVAGLCRCSIGSSRWGVAHGWQDAGTCSSAAESGNVVAAASLSVGREHYEARCLSRQRGNVELAVRARRSVERIGVHRSS